MARRLLMGRGTYDPGADNASTSVAYNYRRYDVRVVDVDPGAAEHVEVALTQSFQTLGFPDGTTGVAPAPTACQPIRRAVVFYWASAYGTAPADLAQLCTDVSRSVADASGLDEILDARSIMSWLTTTNAPRSFLDEDRPCGEYQARECRCGGTTQNSHVRLAAALGLCPG